MAVDKPTLGSYIINDPNQRKEQGIGRNYVDDWNQARMQEYNNDYNYWAWQQQMEYNSPAAQKKRLEEAGLNPNYQSIDSGNVSALAASNGKLSGSAASNRNAAIGNAIASVNTMLKGISDGFDNYGKMARNPSLAMFNSYRDAVTENVKAQAGFAQAQKVGKQMDNLFEGALKGIDPDQLGTDEVRNSPAYGKFLLEADALSSLIAQRENIVYNLTPAQLSEINQRIAQSRAYVQYLNSNIDVNSGRIDLMKAQGGFYKSSEYLNYSKQINTFEHTLNLQEQREVIKQSANKLRNEIKNLGQSYNINQPRAVFGENFGNNGTDSWLYMMARRFGFY